MSWFSRHKWLIIQAIAFAFIALSFILPNGNTSCLAGGCSLQIGEWHMHDALWHISLAKLGFKTWPLSNPFLSGEILKNYNFLLDYLIYLLLKLGISPFFSFFKLLPVLATLLYTATVLVYVGKQTTNQLKANLLAFFLFFGSSATYLATLYHDHSFYYASLRGFPVVSVINSTTMFLNLQYAFSLSIFLWIMLLLKEKITGKKIFFLGILFFLIFGFKFYGGILALGYLLCLQLIRFIKKSPLQNLSAVTISIIGSIAGLIIFYGLSPGSKFPFVFSPFALTRLLIDDQLLFYNHHLTLARYYLLENQTGFPARLILIELYSVVLFIILNFGSRLVGIIYVLRNFFIKKLSDEHLVLALIILITLLIPIFFVQDGGWYNTMQFLYYGAWLMGVFAAEFLFNVLEKSSLPSLLIVLVIFLLTIPSALEQLRFIKADQNIISSQELELYKVLAQLPPGVVHINNPDYKRGLVGALSDKFTYYLDTDQLMVVHADYQSRLATVHKYNGGSITQIEANYYLIYERESGGEDAVRALSGKNYQLIYSTNDLALYRKL